LAFECAEGARFEDVLFKVPHHPPDVSGHIVTSAGEPSPNARIRIEPLFPQAITQQEKADAGGEWGVFAQPSGRHVVTSYVPDEGVAAAVVTVPSSGNRITLGGTGSIDGTIDGMTEGALTFIPVSCSVRPEGLDQRVWIAHMPRERKLVTVDAGRFEIENLPACELQAVLAGKAGHKVFSTRVVAGEAVAVHIALSGGN
jgi:hypothetical protein